jgi:hypothetical protein
MNLALDACGLRDICTETEIKSVVDAIVDQGLDKLGYKFINMYEALLQFFPANPIMVDV